MLLQFLDYGLGIANAFGLRQKIIYLATFSLISVKKSTSILSEKQISLRDTLDDLVLWKKKTTYGMQATFWSALYTAWYSIVLNAEKEIQFHWTRSAWSQKFLWKEYVKTKTTWFKILGNWDIKVLDCTLYVCQLAFQMGLINFSCESYCYLYIAILVAGFSVWFTCSAGHILNA